MKSVSRFAVMGFLAAALAGSSFSARAAQLGQDARASIPKDIQQLIVVDYRAMQNSQAAMDLKGRVLPPELKSLEEALRASGLNDNHDVDQLAFAAFRVGKDADQTRIVGIAQGQFSVADIKASFRKKGYKAVVMGNKNFVYPMGRTGMLVTFLNNTTMLFGSNEAMKTAISVRDGSAQSFLTNDAMMQAMEGVDDQPLWSILDQKGTQFMMRSVLGEAAQLTDYDTVKKRLLTSRYTMNFDNGVKFNLDVMTPDTFTAATMSSVLNAAALYKKMSGTAAEKSAIDATKIDSTAGTLQVRFAASDSQFASLLQSPLFQTVVH